MIRLLPILALATTLAAAPPAPRPPGRAFLEGQLLAQYFQMRVGRIQTSLGLSEDRARGLAERWGRWDRVAMARGRQLAELRQQFNRILVGPFAEEEKNARIKPVLDQFLVLRLQQEEDRRRFEEDILVGLSPAQQARMIVLVEDIQGRLREAIRESREGGGRY